MTAENDRGLVQVFTGNGKGKTTAALGTVLRAAGHGRRTFIVFFMKGDYDYGEFKALLNLPWLRSYGACELLLLQRL